MKNFIKRSLVILSIFSLFLVGIPIRANADTLNANDKYGNMTLNLDKNRHYSIDMEEIFPGEHYFKKMIIKNSHNYPYNIYFKASSKERLTGKSLELLKYINMKIVYDGKTIYNGPANANSMKDIMLIGTVYPDTQKNFEVYIDVSKDLDNSFANIETFNRFDFYSNIVYSGNVRGNSNNGQEIFNNNMFNPKTGDNFRFYIYLISIISCIVILILLNKNKIKKNI